MKSGRVFITLLLLAALASPLWGHDPEDISERDYFPAVYAEIREAKESIVVAMYAFLTFPDSRPSSPALQLLQALIKAHKRGVRVTVILGSPYGYQMKQGSKQRGTRNKTAAQMLSAGGVDVRYAKETATMHGKLIIIDGTTVILGSHNITDSALNRNYEFSNLTRSKEYAAKMLKRVEGIALKPLDPGPAENVVPVPMRFLKDQALAPTMLTKHAERVFDVFLLLWRQYAKSSAADRRAVTLDLDAIAETLGITNEKERFRHRGRVKEALAKLRDEYRLIDYQVPRAENGTFRMARGGLKLPREGAGIAVPVSYWDYGWSRTLSMRAKVVYLISLLEQETGHNAPWWRLSQLKIAKKYMTPNSRSTVNLAIRELERQDILQIRRDWPEKGEDFSQRAPNTYLLNPLLSEEQIEKAWKTLEKDHGKKRLQEARRLAAMLDRPNSRETTAGFARCITTYGLEATETETKDVAKLKPDNPYRHVGTVVYRLKKKALERKQAE